MKAVRDSHISQLGGDSPLAGLIRRQRTRIRRVRTALFVLLILTALSGAALTYTQETTLTPGQLSVAAARDGRLLLVVHDSSFLTLERSYSMRLWPAGAPAAEASPLVSPDFKGVCEDAEFTQDGKIVLLFRDAALVYDVGQGERWSEGGIRRPYPSLLTSLAVPAVVGNETIVAWIAVERTPEGKPLNFVAAAPAGERNAPTERHPLADIDKRIKAIGLFAARGRCHLLVQTEANQLHVLAFDLMKEIRPAPSEPAAPAATADIPAHSAPLVPPVPGEAPHGDDAASKPPDGGDDANTSQPQGITAVASGSSGTHPNHAERDAVQTQVYAIRNPKRYDVPGTVMSFDGVSGADGMLILVRRGENEPWLGLYGADTGWSGPFPLPQAEHDSGGADAKENANLYRPLYELTPEYLERYTLAEGGTVLRRSRASLGAQGIGEWSEAPALVLGGRKPLASAYSLLMLLMVSLSAAVGCMIWLSLNREQDVERALNAAVRSRTGRDTRVAGRPVGLMSSDRMMYAGPIRRALGLMVDLAVLTPVIYLIISAREMDIEKALNLWPRNVQHLIDGLPERLVTLAIFAIYGFICEAWMGRTLGKMVLSMRVQRTAGGPAGLLGIFVRNLLRVIELAHPMIAAVSVITLIVTRRHQRVGDLLGGTAVRIVLPDEDEDDDDTTARLPSE